MRAVNLIPKDARRGGGAGRGGRSGGVVYVVLGGLAVLVVMVGMWVLAGQDGKTARADVERLEQRAQDLDNQALPFARYQSVAQTGVQQLMMVKGLADARFDWAAALSDLARTLPSSVRLDSLDGVMEAAPAAPVATAPPAGAAASGAAPAPAAAPGPAPVLKLKGCAPSLEAVSRLVPRMRLVPGVADVTLGPATVPSRRNRASMAAGCTAATFELSLRFAGIVPAAPDPAVAATAPGTDPAAGATQ